LGATRARVLGRVSREETPGERAEIPYVAAAYLERIGSSKQAWDWAKADDHTVMSGWSKFLKRQGRVESFMPKQPEATWSEEGGTIEVRQEVCPC